MNVNICKRSSNETIRMSATQVSAASATVSLPFKDREDAAHQLANALHRYAGTRPVVLAIPRGGVPIGSIVADALGGQLDVVLVRKLGAPGQPEFAIGAIDERGAVMLNEGLERLNVDSAYLQQEADRQLEVIRARRKLYRPQHTPLSLAGRTVIVVDDGLATGATMTAALMAAKAQLPQRLICAVPVAARESLAPVARLVDEIVCLAAPEPFWAVGHFYRAFSGVSEAEVIQLLREPDTQAASAAMPSSRLVQVSVGAVPMEGELRVPEGARGLVLFAHGSGSSRHSPRNQAVAQALHRSGFATLLLDLLTPFEDRDPAARFDIPLLATRLTAAVDWALQDPALRALPIGLFGASTGAAAALRVAAARPELVRAVVSRGGRPDMAGTQILAGVHAPTLLIVGGEDQDVLVMNRQVQAGMPGSARLVIVPGATHLFEEPGALEQVADAAGDWFQKTLAA